MQVVVLEEPAGLVGLVELVGLVGLVEPAKSRGLKVLQQVR
jgi:hypothetical protein